MPVVSICRSSFLGFVRGVDSFSCRVRPKKWFSFFLEHSPWVLSILSPVVGSFESCSEIYWEGNVVEMYEPLRDNWADTFCRGTDMKSQSRDIGNKKWVRESNHVMLKIRNGYRINSRDVGSKEFHLDLKQVSSL